MGGRRGAAGVPGHGAYGAARQECRDMERMRGVTGVPGYEAYAGHDKEGLWSIRS
ncbi:MAG: hypothetical protein HFH91_08425 [Lachnospiraceae bacterium]|nr:hypothetical protein [Lachnospiraceae bacterium]